MVDDALALHGRLDCLINNAGIYRRDHFANQTGEDWSLVFGINLESVFHIVHQALPALVASRGNVVSTASTAGVQGIAYAAAYAASKAGIIAMTKSLATEYAPKGVRFNAICPGRVRTEIGTGLQPIENQDPNIMVKPPKLAGKGKRRARGHRQRFRLSGLRGPVSSPAPCWSSMAPRPWVERQKARRA